MITVAWWVLGIILFLSFVTGYFFCAILAAGKYSDLLEDYYQLKQVVESERGRQDVEAMW